MKLSSEGDLLYATYIGGSGGEESIRISLDDECNIYVCGSTWSYDFPITGNALQKKKKNGSDFFIIKFDKTLRPVASTYLGGNGFDYCTNINIAGDKIYLTGRTNSSDFPVTKGVADMSYYDWQSPKPGWQNMVIDVSVAVISSNLDSLLYATYAGGRDRDEITSVTFDAENNLVLTGITWSDDYPTTSGCYDSTLNGQRDGFISILNPDLSGIIYSTFIGGNAVDDITNSAEIDACNNLILSGNTNSADFPVTSDALYSNFSGGEADGFIMKFDLSAHKPVYSTFVGGRGSDEIKHFTAIDKQRYLLLAHTRSDNFPVTADASDTSFNGGYDIAFSIFDDKLKRIEYSGFIGGAKDDKRLRAMVNGSVLFITLHSTSPDFPVTKKLIDFENMEMAVLMKIDLSKK